ncbi:MAG: bifunctional oligoribonuclease/PAP phosphatase NrnA [Armatimonadetes bacterium]|nr:bifunctional oligoribonuclease/PAP phosphatase NrnA [Armatimonadota bacterium]
MISVTTESNPPFTEQFQELLRLVKQSGDVLIGTHLNPDGDAIGSALAVSHWLDGLGVRNEVLCHNEPPGYLRFLPGSDRLRREPERSGHQLGIVVDLDSLDRLGSCRPYFEALPTLVLIDHHQPHEMPGDLRIVDPASPATAAILTDLFACKQNPVAVDIKIAECLMTGLVTDTGSFRFPNTTAHSLHQAAWLQERGAQLSKVADEVYLNRDEQAVRLLGEAIHLMKTACAGRLAWVVLPPSLFEQLGALEEHTEGIVNEILSIRTVSAAFVLRAGKFGKVKGSLRSKGDLDVAKVAQAIGGGGHKNAAGVTLEGSLEVAESVVVKAMSEALGC